MSALTPLYLLGVLAVAAPIVFHLIRRSPSGQIPFSSLLFLTPSPPRLARRSRLDNILLLILRASVLCLLAFAFARPFLRQKAEWNVGENETRRRTAVLIDTSASLRRGNLWDRARAEARRALGETGPTDEIALLAFDRSTRPVVTFRESSQMEAGRRQALALARLDELKPSWNGTDLGRALIDAVAAIEDIADPSESAGRIPRRIVLVTDLQRGSRLESLGEFEWPKDVELIVRAVTDDASNAGLQRLADPTEGDREPRIRVINDGGSRRERFRLRWLGVEGKPIGEPVDAYVPPGESRVVRMPRPKEPASARSIVLEGDGRPFDNTLHVADEPQQEVIVLFLGDDRADDPEGLLYYLDRVFLDTPRRTVRVVAQAPSAPIAIDPAHPVPLAIVAAEVPSEQARRLRDLARSGSTILDVATRPSRGQTLATLLDVPARPIEESRSREALIGEIAFDHPIFAPFAPPQFRDFTKIHFWKHRKLHADSLAGARILARFDDGDPAVAERPIEKGSVIVLTSGWSRSDSQLARSSKFVPMMMAMLDRRDPRAFADEEHLVGDSIKLPATRGMTIRKPSGASISIPSDASVFDQADEPGIYTFELADGPRSIAVNLDPAESRTEPIGIETLEQYGCRLAKPAHEPIDREQLRQLQNAELEGRQKLWRWLILTAVGILIVETGLAGRGRRVLAGETGAGGPSS